MKRHVISVLVENRSGVLSRVSGLFSRRGYNIDSLTVGVTSDPAFSRMTIVARCDGAVLAQIRKQLAKLVEVTAIEVCPPEETVTRELALIKVSAGGTARAGIIEVANIFRARIVDVAPSSLVIEATGSEEKIAGLLRLLEPFGILELVRTGLTAMRRGAVLLTPETQEPVDSPEPAEAADDGTVPPCEITGKAVE